MKKICITGASKGIGLEEALLLNKNNDLYLCASNIASFQKKGLDGAYLFGYNLSQLEEIDTFTHDITSQTDRLDVLVNNVGVFLSKKFEDMHVEDIDHLLNLNLRATIVLTKKLLPLLLKSNDPQIVFMSSMAAKSSINGESVYAATKAGISNFANVLRNELGDKIRISTIHSWGVNTFGADPSLPLLHPQDIAHILQFIISCPKPLLVESIDVSHQGQWRGGNAPRSP